jgi:hypothetical protein
MKVRIVQGGIGTYEVQIKKAWYLPWATIYDGFLPWRGSLSEAQKIKEKLILKYSR